eukprot:Seg1010.22 transcript_id=Seg1010.22/GoldUCD/mRNA.D3Y31 product="Phosphoinositide 3-kinase adapter protein 1" protein_id=Seg1010.22/GoldUCD/D3Y31
MAHRSQLTPTPAPRPLPRNLAPAVPKKTRATKSSSSDFSITHISPSSVIYNKREVVLLVFNESLPSNVEFTVKFIGLNTQSESITTAEKISENVLKFVAPEHYPPEETRLSVHHGNHFTKLCSYHPFVFKSYLEQIKGILFNISDPIEFMCAALHLKQKSSVALDFELERQFSQNLPPNFDLLAGDRRHRIKEVQDVVANPTLLHFAARYNLVKLAVAILSCPGGYGALNMQNIDQLTPSQIAFECGHEKLANVLADAQQHPNVLEEADEIYVSMHDANYDKYVDLVNSEQWDDIYMPMNLADEEELYTTMPGEESEEIYQNTQEISSQYQTDDIFPSPSIRGGMSSVDGIPSPRHLDLPDSRSIYSVSSTSSGDSNTSASSGSDGVVGRPMMPTPRKSPSLPEKSFNETLGAMLGKTHSKSQKLNKPAKEPEKYSSLPRKASGPARLQNDYTYHAELPPPPPQRYQDNRR